MRSRAKEKVTPWTAGGKLQSILLGALFVLCTRSLVSADAASPSIRNDIASINIQTSAATYSAGQPVLIRVGIKNISPQTYAFNNGAPWGNALLVIKNAAGNPVSPVNARDTTGPFRADGYLPRVVQPGQTMWLSWESNDWSDISHWGFKLGPGTYTISAIPLVAGVIPPTQTHQTTHSYAAPQGKFVTDLTTVNSNTVTVQITP